MQTLLGVNSSAAEGPSPEWALVVPVREPVSHYLSWFSYFIQPARGDKTLEAWVADGRGGNEQPLEFGLRTADDVAAFVKNVSWGCERRHSSAPEPG